MHTASHCDLPSVLMYSLVGVSLCCHLLGSILPSHPDANGFSLFSFLIIRQMSTINTVSSLSGSHNLDLSPVSADGRQDRKYEVVTNIEFVTPPYSDSHHTTPRWKWWKISSISLKQVPQTSMLISRLPR